MKKEENIEQLWNIGIMFLLETVAEVLNPNQPFLLQNQKDKQQSISKPQESFESGKGGRTILAM